MRILHLGFEDHRRPGSGGGSLRNAEINRRIAARHRITVLVANYQGAERRVEDGVEYVPVGLPLGYFPSLVSYFLLVPFVARGFPAELVVEEFAAPISSVLMPVWTTRPTLAVVQWMNSREKSRQYRLPFFLFEMLGVRLHRRFVTVSDDMRERIHASNHRAQVSVIPNGVADPQLAPDLPRGADIVYLGRLELAQKGIDLLLTAFAQQAALIQGNLVIAGDGPDRKAIEKLAAGLGIAHRVQFAGRVEGAAKFDLLGRARLVVMPSRFETFGIVAIEALAAGTPVIAFDIPCLREVVPADCGRLVPAFEVESLAAAVAELYPDQARIAQMGAAGKEFARQFDWDEIALRQEQVYEDVVRAAQAGRHRKGPG
ncbi:glycosyltransferase family 4 protein [Kineosporia babensis]|uniref:Glycosyltransferase family 4 protein n=1 Tax=Kineosporia babensis TaxID=499548 RepID=A0A9X1NP71_9ACTN|nr:glycosyltransferase family 4 protein [Kineosporia babensis]MCD5316731.1 glycosyltransferase family 4 protein [Kineosporia babensis]